jgi:hypothetical protein
MELLFKADEVKQLDAYIGEIPAKFAVPLLTFINSVAQKRQQEAAIASKASVEKSVPAPIAELASDEATAN